MKKSALVAVLFVLFFVVAFVSVLQAAMITNLEGNVQVQSAADKSWTKAKVGMAVNIGDSIQTARSSMADVALDESNKNTIRVDESTLVVITSSNAADINKLDLSHGKVYANVEEVKAGLGFEVKTPSAVAGVRGTGLSVESSQRRDEVAAFKDSVFVKSFDSQGRQIDEITIPEGFKAMVERFEKAGELSKLSEDEMDRFNNMKEGRSGQSSVEQRAEKVAEIQKNTTETINEIKEQVEQTKAEETAEERGCVESESECGPY